MDKSQTLIFENLYLGASRELREFWYETLHKLKINIEIKGATEYFKNHGGGTNSSPDLSIQAKKTHQKPFKI